jgi:hypothetical protein
MEQVDVSPSGRGQAADIPPACSLGPRSWVGAVVRPGLLWIFVLIAVLPVIDRLRHPTLLGDDVTRVVDLIDHPLRQLLFRPFGEHVAPSFELVTWLTWQAIHHDIRLAPLGYTIASVLPWVLLLSAFGLWLKRETLSSTASLVAVALVAQSPLALDAMWWYSASWFNWAFLAVLLALLGAGLLKTRPRGALALIVSGAALAPSFATVGLLAVPLVVVQTLFDAENSRRRKILGVLAAVIGLAAYLLVYELAGTGIFRTIQHNKRGTIEPLAGLEYALSVPGQVLWPAMIGVRPSWTIKAWPSWLATGLGVLVLGITATLALWHKARWNRRLVLVGAAMIYLGYMLTYSSRVCMVRQGFWTEPQLLYEFAGRYHVLPLLGLAALLAAVLASLSVVRRCDKSPVRSVFVGILAGLLALAVNRPEQKSWRWMLGQPDQKATLAALYRVGEVARAEGISRDQLSRIFDSALRSWNGCLRDHWAFPLTKLVVQAPEKTLVALPDDVARARLMSRLKPDEWLVIQAGACVSMNPARPDREAKGLATARLVVANHASEVIPGHYRWEHRPFYLEYEVDAPAEARFLELPGLAADQDLQIQWADELGRWRTLQYVCWLHDPVPKGPAVIDVRRLANWPSGQVARFRVQLTSPGELTLQGDPRILR